MHRRELTHLAGLLALAVLVRALLFDKVGVWGDAGFYVYDARLINAGQTPFVDFIGRSPLFNYLYAWVATWAGNSMQTLRAFVAAPWILTGIPVYAIGRELHSHRAGLAAAALLLLSPFMLVYAYWANTQSVMALTAACAVALLVWRRTTLTYGAAGVLFGLAFLSRRSVITVMLGLALWMALETYRSDRPLPSAFVERVGHGLALLAGFGVALVGLYGWMVGFDPGTTLALAETHAWGLISSNGRGGFPLITTAAAPSTQNEIDVGRIPIFNDVCQMCGAWTARTFAKTILATVPLVGPLAYYYRDWADRWFTDVERDYTLGIVGLLTVYGIVLAIQAGYYVRPVAILTLVLFAVVAFRTPAIDRDILYGRELSMLLLMLVGLTAGYLFRNRVVHTYYFADFVPFLAVVVGIIYVEAWRNTDG